MRRAAALLVSAVLPATLAAGGLGMDARLLAAARDGQIALVRTLLAEGAASGGGDPA